MNWRSMLCRLGWHGDTFKRERLWPKQACGLCGAEWIDWGEMHRLIEEEDKQRRSENIAARRK